MSVISVTNKLNAAGQVPVADRWVVQYGIKSIPPVITKQDWIEMATMYRKCYNQRDVFRPNCTVIASTLQGKLLWGHDRHGYPLLILVDSEQRVVYLEQSTIGSCDAMRVAGFDIAEG